MSNFKTVAPGVAVSGNVKVSIPHPDPCYVIHNPEQTAARAMGDNLLIFSDEKKAETFMGNHDKKSYLVKKYSWKELVSTFGNQYSNATIDHEGKEGWYTMVPISEDI